MGSIFHKSCCWAQGPLEVGLGTLFYIPQPIQAENPFKSTTGFAIGHAVPGPRSRFSGTTRPLLPLKLHQHQLLTLIPPHLAPLRIHQTRCLSPARIFGDATTPVLVALSRRPVLALVPARTPLCATTFLSCARSPPAHLHRLHTNHIHRSLRPLFRTCCACPSSRY